MTPTVAAVDRPAAPAASGSRFAEEVCRDLSLSPKQLQSKYLYDALGSCLFEAICRLPWYRITRAEQRLLAEQTSFIVGQFSDPLTFIELGCGSGEKLALLAQALRSGRRRVRVHLIDISATALELSARTLGTLEHVSVVGHRSTYEVGLRLAAELRQPRETLMVLLLGSNIGNFDPPAAHEFLTEIRAALLPGDALLLGADLVKPETLLKLAYDDPLGVTSAFNKNLLARINAELDADFDLDGFTHRAVWDAARSRVEMHLVSGRDQIVSVFGGRRRFSFAEGEWIWTESSYKFEPEKVVEMGAAAGFACRAQWIEPEARFALSLFEANGEAGFETANLFTGRGPSGPPAGGGAESR